MVAVKIGIIGGSGLDKSHIFANKTTKEVETPYGKPSGPLTCGEVAGVPCVLVARHGPKHTFMPGNVNFRANLWALKEDGITHLIVSTACGSLKEGVHPRELLVPDQIIDRTTKRVSTFYDGTANAPRGVMHMPMAHPFDEHLRKIMLECAEKTIPDVKVHSHGTVVTIEGPRFSTKAESELFRSWGCSIINMTTCPEAFLANELGIPYAAIGMVTDYDCWLEDPNAHVSVQEILEIMKVNGENVMKLFLEVIPTIAAGDWDEHLEKKKQTSAGSIMLFD
eukprot:Clim_evm16s54 gene=Clim_evmTU16s54